MNSLDVNVNVPLQISRGIFVHDEIIYMHIIRDGNYTVMKQPRNGRSRAKQINKKQSV